MQEILLPPQVFEYSLLDFIKLLGNSNDADSIIVDFQYVNYYVPGALVTLITKFHKWLGEGKEISLKNYDKCNAYKYLQRIDFFKHCGVQLNEDFQRHSSKGRFVPIRDITYDTDSLATEIATCMEPELAESEDIETTGPFDYFEYSISELGNNTIQHSRGKGFACAQYTKNSDYIRVAIADTGIGIKNSFKENASPYYYEGLNDVGAIKKALEPEISSKTHLHSWGNSPNMGVGLTLLWETVHRMGGKFIIVSGEGYISTDLEVYLNSNNCFNGTLCSFMFKRCILTNFYTLLNDSKRNLGLIKGTKNFEGLFL